MNSPSTVRRSTTQQFLSTYGQGALDLAQALGGFNAWLAAYAEFGEEEGTFDRCLRAEERLNAVIARRGPGGGISLNGRFVDLRDPDHFAMGHRLERVWYRYRG